MQLICYACGNVALSLSFTKSIRNNFFSFVFLEKNNNDPWDLGYDNF